MISICAKKYDSVSDSLIIFHLSLLPLFAVVSRRAMSNCVSFPCAYPAPALYNSIICMIKSVFQVFRALRKYPKLNPTYTPIWARLSAATRSVSPKACLKALEAIWVYLFQLLM